VDLMKRTRLLTAACALLVSGTAFSAYAVTPQPVSTHFDLRFPTPQVSIFGDGTGRQVWSMQPVGDTMYVAGKFSHVRARATRTDFDRASVYAFEMSGTSRGRLTRFAPVVKSGAKEGTVHKIITSLDGRSLILAGNFTSVNGVAASNLAKVSLTTGAVEPFARANGQVVDVEKAHGLYFLSGSFTTINGTAQIGIATVTPTGGFSTYFRSRLAGQISSTAGSTKAYRLAIKPDESAMVAIVNTATIDGFARKHLAKWTLGTTSATLQNWAPPKTRDTACSQFMAVRDVTYDTDGLSFFSVASGGGRYNGVCDQQIKWLDSARGTSVTPVWSNRSCADTFHGALVYRGVLYASGHQRCVEQTPGGTQDYVDRLGISAIRADNGNALPWRSDQPRCEGGKVLVVGGGFMWAGTDCGDANGQGVYARSTTP
jgi:hypothetical protein